MNARYDIINMQILIKSKEQLNSSLGKNHSEIFEIMKLSIYSTKLSKMFSQITFLMKQLLVMIDTHLGLTTKIKQLIEVVNNTYTIYILSNKNPQIFEKVNYLQNQLKLLTESNKERYY